MDRVVAKADHKSNRFSPQSAPRYFDLPVQDPPYLFYLSKSIMVSDVCISCLDDGEVVVFRCKGYSCKYQLCSPCIKIAFEDVSGAASTFCAMCKTPSALDMIASVCGPAAIKVVEEKLRGPMEFKLREENLKRDASRDRAEKTSDHARRLFNELTEKINLKCPRCKAVFSDYEGCNALTCSVPSCRAGFCAICLQDCGNDAHQHIYTVHGDAFDKAAFKKNQAARAQVLINELKETLSYESFELRQLVLNHVEKAKLTLDGTSSGESNAEVKAARFLNKSKSELLSAAKNDRLALFSDREDYDRRGHFGRDKLSPRNTVPRDYRLVLTRAEGDIFRFAIYHNIIVGEDHWTLVDDIDAHFKQFPKIESLLNVAQALRSAVIAFSGETTLYQTSQNKNHERSLANNEVCIHLNVINTDGSVLDLAARPLPGARELEIIGLNQNKRMILLERHVEKASSSSLMFSPLQHLIGAGDPIAVLTDIEMYVPESLVDLNEQQQRVAHPLRLKTAMEIAGPPGTGKTKTIVELVRSLLQCTSYDIILLSERNGAINAVADKFKIASLDINGENISITDLSVWSSVMAYGAGESMGDCTKLFTMEAKLR